MSEIWTLGHSTHTTEIFLNLVVDARIELVADVRSYPSSRRYPHFNACAIRDSLAAAGIDYLHFPLLGGRRRANPDSLNIRWRHPAFRGYADYMESEEFSRGAGELEATARERRTVYLCSESVWWKCHRSMISDFLLCRGWRVQHIMPDGQMRPHHYTQPARIECGCLTYHEETPTFHQMVMF